MKDEIREQISALIDDELTDMERPLLLGRLQRDAELRACMGRYQLIGDVIHGGVTQATGLGIAGRVQDALADDHKDQDSSATVQDAVVVDRQEPERSFWKPAVGFAIAASVALVAVLSVQNLQQSTPDTPQVATTETLAPPIVQVSTSQDAGQDHWDRIEPQVDKRLSGYLVNHSEFAASQGMHGLTPYVRVVGFEDAQ